MYKAKTPYNKFNLTREKNETKNQILLCACTCITSFFSAHILAPEDNTKTLSQSVYLIKKNKQWLLKPKTDCYKNHSQWINKCDGA